MNDFAALRRIAAEDRSPLAIGPLTPWACSYTGPDGGRYCITLHGSDPEQVVNDNLARLPGLTIDGVLHGSGPLGDRP
ncbi:MAG: hypothetical protein LCH92_08190 [Proteobacteria bacterium]|nr:hypothetical protein [Pseudomonadota bacterium]